MAETIRIRANCHLIKAVVSQVISIKKLIDDRDVGDIVAVSVEDAVRASPLTIRLTVIFFSLHSPPYKAIPGKRFVKATYNIPDADPKKLNWQTIKTACGGEAGYQWGHFRASGQLSNGRQMQVYGSSAVIAETRLQALASLSTAKLLTVTIAEEKKEGIRVTDPKLYKESTMVYPAYFSIINSKKIIAESNLQLHNTVSNLAGKFKRKATKKIPLWLKNEPSTAKTLIKEALTIRT